MSTATVSSRGGVLVSESDLLPTSSGPRPAQESVPSAVSFGFRHVATEAPAEVLDFSHLRYEPSTGTNVDSRSGKPAIFSPDLASTTYPNTTEDMQTWTDSDTD